jgi:hypothetical protein
MSLKGVFDHQRQIQLCNSQGIATLVRGKGEGDTSSSVPSSSSPYLTSEMEPLALKSLVSKINILPHLTKKATAEQHENKDHISLNRGSVAFEIEDTSSCSRHLCF